MVALLAGCGTDAQHVDVVIPGKQVLVTEKLNNGAWKKLSGQFDDDLNNTTYSVETSDEFELVVVCTRSGALDAGEFVAGEVFGTSEDADVVLGLWTPPNCLNKWSGLPDAQEAPSIRLTGSADEPMNLAVDHVHTVHTEPGVPFAFSTFAGRHDLIALGDTSIVIEHDVQLDADTELVLPHVASNGTPLPLVTVSLALQPDEQARIASWVATKNGAFHIWMATGPSVSFVPDEQLTSGDVRTFSIAVESSVPGGERYQRASDPLDLTDPTVLPRLAPFTRHGDGVGASWTPISEFFTSATILTETSSAHPSSQYVTASKPWLDRHGKSSLDFDLDVDGYDPAWVSTALLGLALERAQRTSVLRTTYYDQAGI